MSGRSTSPISEKDGRSHDDTERPGTASKSPSELAKGTEMAGDIQSTAQVTDMEPPSERPAAQGNKYSSFTAIEKKAIVFGAAVGAFFSPLSGQIYFPALDALSRDLRVSVNEVNLTVTTYMIVQAIAPMFVGSLADTAGRRPAYILCFIIYIAACVGCALAPTYAALLVLRALQSAGSSATVALCQAVVSDTVTSAERGSYVGFISVPIILAPSIGPVIGGLISQYLGWRWIFWFLTILAGFVLILFLFFMPETCRLIVGDGSIRPHPYYRTLWQLLKDARSKRRATRETGGASIQPDATRDPSRKSLRIQRPKLTHSLFILFEKEMFLLLTYSSLIYAGFYAVLTSIPAEFARLYGFDGLKIGLVYLPLGVGSIVSVFVMGKLANWNYRRYCKKLGIPYDKSRQQDMADFPIEKVRLQVSLPFLAVFTAVLIGFGWAVEYKAHVAVEIVLLFLQGISLIGFSNLQSTLIVDINPGAAGAATAANNLTRCLVGAGASAFISPLIGAVGSGWAFTIIALSFVVFFPALWLVLENGAKWRKIRMEKEKLKQEQKKQQQEGNDAENSGQEIEKAHNAG